MSDEETPITDEEEAQLLIFQEAKFLAGVALLGRCGATATQIRYSDDEVPTIWFVVALWELEDMPAESPFRQVLADNDREHHFEVAAASSPQKAVIDLLEKIVDGGHCTYCHKQMAFFPEPPDTSSLGTALLLSGGCIISYDEDTESYTRSCQVKGAEPKSKRSKTFIGGVDFRI